VLLRARLNLLAGTESRRNVKHVTFDYFYFWQDDLQRLFKPSTSSLRLPRIFGGAFFMRTGRNWR
jgi:hypothetical protein